MFSRCLLIIFLVVFLLFSSTANIANAGDIVFETVISWFQWWSEIHWGMGGFTRTSYVAISYTPTTDQEVCTVKPGLYKSGNPIDDVVMTVKNSSTVLGSVTLPASQVAGPPILPQQTTYTEFKFSPCLNLFAGIGYFFVISRTQVGSGGEYVSQLSNLISYPQVSFWGYVPVQGFQEKPAGYEPAFRLEGPDEPAKTPVLIIPGIAGSELYNGDDLIWADLGEMARDIGDEFLRENLSLDSNGSSVKEIEAKNAIERLPDNTLGNIRFFGVNIFNGLRNALETDADYVLDQNLFYFSYDWRLNLDSSKDLLNTKIEEIKSQTGASKVNIIAHSMGGLLTKDYINTYGKNSIDKLIFIGTPHLGAPKAGKVILVGENFSIPWLEEERFKELARNSPALHEILPNQKYFDSFSGYIQKSGTDSLFNYSETKDFLISQNSSSLIMGLAEDFWSKNLENTDFSGIDVYNFAGCSSSTQAGYRLKSDNISIGNIGYTSGDKTVPLVSSNYINIPDDNKFYLKKATHAEMPSQEDIRAGILSILDNNDIAISGNLKTDSTECNFSGKTLIWHSPVGVHIYDSQDRHTGPIENEGIEYGVPGVDYEIIGHDKFIFLPIDTGETYNIIAEGLATGSFDLLISQNNNGTIESTTVFNDVPIGESGDVNFNVSNSSPDSNINVDYYGNDVVQNVPASSVLSGNNALDVIPPETQATVSGQAGSSGWYFGNVTIDLSAIDDNSGLLETKYSLDGQPFEIYSNPISVVDEGMHTILYYSVDRAGNNETTQDLSFGIDMTGLEISVIFDIDAERFVFSPVGDSLENVSFSCDLVSCTATDRAGNTTKLEFTFEQKGRKQFLNFSSVSYNGIENGVSENQFTVKLWEKNDELKDFDQIFLIKKEEKLKIDYKLKRDESVITHRLIPGKPTRETISGKRFLQIFTDKGKIEYIIL